MTRTDYSQKRKPVYLDKNNKVCYSKDFICKSILELMNANLKKHRITDKRKVDMSVRDGRYFHPTSLYNELSDYFEAFYNKRPDKNTFYLCINLLEKDRKIERIKIKKTLYYKLKADKFKF